MTCFGLIPVLGCSWGSFLVANTPLLILFMMMMVVMMVKIYGDDEDGVGDDQ